MTCWVIESLVQQNYTNITQEYTESFKNNLQLYATDESPKEAHHTQEFHSA